MTPESAPPFVRRRRGRASSSSPSSEFTARRSPRGRGRTSKSSSGVAIGAPSERNGERLRQAISYQPAVLDASEMSFSIKEAEACRHLVALALQEDLGAAGDLTSQAVIPPDLQASATFVARAPGVLAGLPAVEHVVHAVDARLSLQALKTDGDPVSSGDRIASI